MTSLFHVKEHVVDAQHIREYARATTHSQEEKLQLAVKQYIPKDNPNPRPGDVTIVASHANGFPKELYEAMWEELLSEAAKHGFRIRSIFIADIAWQGVSGIMNEDKLGNDPSWLDHPRDLMYMINQLRDEMPRPLIGIGHSFGGTIVTAVSLMHPRLFSGIILLDPVMNFTRSGPAFGTSPLVLSASRRDLWPSREAAAEAFKRSKFYQGWDPRVLQAWIDYGLRPTPTAVYPDGDCGVTLTTTKHMEVFTYLRPLMQGVDRQTGRRTWDESKLFDLPTKEDVHTAFGGGKLYRPEAPWIARQLPALRPGALWIFGGTSGMSTPALIREKMELCGTGLGGSGGEPKGRAKSVVLDGVGHLVAMERPRECAAHTAEWIAKELVLWREEEEDLKSWWAKSQRQKQILDEEWLGFIEDTKEVEARSKL